jgi:predicted RNA methylase
MTAAAVLLPMDAEPEAPQSAPTAYDDIEAMVSARNAAIEHWRAFFVALEGAHEHRRLAQDTMMQACQGFGFSSHVGDDSISAFAKATELPSIGRLFSTAVQLVDIRMWSAVLDRSGLEYLMDKQAKQEWSKQLAFIAGPEIDPRTPDDALEPIGGVPGKLPPFTAENVRASIRQWREESIETFARGVANVFSALDSRFKSHDGFKVGSRVILGRMFSEWGSSRYETIDSFVDVERAFMVLDGVPRPEIDPWRGVTDEDLAKMHPKLRACYHQVEGETAWHFGLSGILRRRRSTPHQSEHESPYMKVRVFKNGNAHLWFKRPDLVASINALLADYYGGALGYGRESYDEDGQVVEPAKTSLLDSAVDRPAAKNLGFYQTPPELAARVIELAGIAGGHRVLEPSAGTGALISAALKSLARTGKGIGPLLARAFDLEEVGGPVQIVAVELDPKRAAGLMGSHPWIRVVPGDFLSIEPEQLGEFDRIVMNPPFDRGRDLDHVAHALRFLKPGGTLVSITSASARYSSTSRGSEFRKRLESLPHRWADLPPGSFKDAGTMVNTCLLRVGTNSWF